MVSEALTLDVTLRLLCRHSKYMFTSMELVQARREPSRGPHLVGLAATYGSSFNERRAAIFSSDPNLRRNFVALVCIGSWHVKPDSV